MFLVLSCLDENLFIVVVGAPSAPTYFFGYHFFDVNCNGIVAMVVILGLVLMAFLIAVKT